MTSPTRMPRTPPSVEAVAEPQTPFRFYDNRQKYLAFVNTCNEKSVVARRAAKDLSVLKPKPPALRMFDAGMGDATVLTRLMGSVHREFPTVPLVGRRQGNQPGGRAARARENARPLPRAPAHGVRRHQPELHGSAPASCARGLRDRVELAYGAAAWSEHLRVHRADRSAGADAVAAVADAAESPDRQSNSRPAVGRGAVPRGPRVHSRCRHSHAADARSEASTSSWPRSRGGRARRRRSRRARCWRPSCEICVPADAS